MRRLIALDVDGTLLNSDRHITPRVKSAIYTAIQQGHIVTLATGRRFRSAKGVAEELGLAVPLIMNQGALCYDMQQGQALYQRTLKPDFIRQAVALVREADYSPGIFQSPVLGEYIYIGPPEYDSEEVHYYATEPRRADLIRRLDYAAMPSIELPLVVMAIGPTDRHDELKAILTSRLDCQVFSYSLVPDELRHFSGFDIIPPDVSKGQALLWLAQHFDVLPEHTLAIGDGHNDIEMLKAAGIGVAMGNAEPAVQAAADYITATNDEDGVALAIEKHVLGDWYLYDEAYYVREAAIDSVFSLYTPEGFEALVKVLDDPTLADDLFFPTITGLGRLPDERVFDVLFRFLHDLNGNTRIAAIRGLSLLGDERAIEQLKILQKTDTFRGMDGETVQQAAAKALKELAKKRN